MQHFLFENIEKWFRAIVLALCFGLECIELAKDDYLKIFDLFHFSLEISLVYSLKL